MLGSLSTSRKKARSASGFGLLMTQCAPMSIGGPPFRYACHRRAVDTGNRLADHVLTETQVPFVTIVRVTSTLSSVAPCGTRASPRTRAQLLQTGPLPELRDSALKCRPQLLPS